MSVIDSLQGIVIHKRLADRYRRCVGDVEGMIRTAMSCFDLIDGFFSETTPSRNKVEDEEDARDLLVHGEDISLDMTDGSVLVINGQDARMRYLANSREARERWVPFEHLEKMHPAVLAPREWPPNQVGTNL